jgi:hypothetical protein
MVSETMSTVMTFCDREEAISVRTNVARSETTDAASRKTKVREEHDQETAPSRRRRLNLTFAASDIVRNACRVRLRSNTATLDQFRNLGRQKRGRGGARCGLPGRVRSSEDKHLAELNDVLCFARERKAGRVRSIYNEGRAWLKIQRPAKEMDIGLPEAGQSADASFERSKLEKMFFNSLATIQVSSLMN